MKLVMYVRSLSSNPRLREYLATRYPQQLEMFEQIINSTEA